MDNISINTSPCDTFSYLYFCLAILLFACGSAITLLSIEGSDLFNTTLSRFWFVGPFFLCSGLMVAFKTLIYIRRKTLITLLAPQNMLSSINDEAPTNYWMDYNQESFENLSNTSLPPSYESAIASSSIESNSKTNNL